MGKRFPIHAGTYILLLYLRKGERIGIGRLGTISFSRGWYAYVGSACGPGGLAARLTRHLRREKKLRWHIDYLRAVAEPRRIWFDATAVVLEHLWANALLDQNAVPIPGFGCTDCRCVSHLYYFRRYHTAVTMLAGLKGEIRSRSYRLT